MIKKLTTGEYLKDYITMSAQEREAYGDRVGEWLASDGARLLAMTDRPMARSQNLMTMSVRWSREDCDAVHEGTVLLTALMAVTDTWLPSQLWTKSAWRALRKLVGELSSIHHSQFIIHNGAGAAKEETAVKTRKGTQSVAAQASPASGMAGDVITVQQTKGHAADVAGAVAGDGASGVLASGMAGDVIAAQQTKGHAADVAGTADAAGTANGRGTSGVPVRPKHIDQYVHLLPKGAQERAAQVKGLLRDLDVMRENARRLMEAGESGNKVAQWSRAAAQLDEKVNRIYRELDAEWEKLVRTGRVVVDALGYASVLPDADAAGAAAEVRAAVGEVTGTVADVTATAKKEGLSSEQKARRRELRKWLIDLRRGKEGKAKEKRAEQWRENWKEYLTLEPLELALKDEKVVKAAEHFGIEAIS